MIFPYWCLLIGGLLPYTMVQIARGPAYDNARPREGYDVATGLRKRAYGAEMNSFEVFPFFAAAVLVAVQAGMQSTLLNVLVGAWVVSRVIYIVAYLKDMAGFRTAIWGLGVLLVVAIITMPAWAPFFFGASETPIGI